MAKFEFKPKKEQIATLVVPKKKPFRLIRYVKLAHAILTTLLLAYIAIKVS